MIVNLSPDRSDAPIPDIRYRKDTLIINDVTFDFSSIPEGATLPASAIDSPWFLGAVERVDGEIVLTLLLPHGPNPSSAVAFPEPIRVTRAGAVKLPFEPMGEEK